MRQSRIERQTDAFRERVIALEGAASKELEAAYRDTLKELQPRIDALAAKIASAQAAGEEVNLSWLFQEQRYLELQRQLVSLIDQYGQTTKAVTTATQRVIVRESLVNAGQMLLPVSGGDGSAIAELARGWAAVPDDSIVNLVGSLQSGTPLDATISTYAPDAVVDVRKALTRGLALGDSSLDTARIVAQALNITRVRAETIVRTETLRAARTATMAAYQASGVVTMVRWSASLSERTCGYCLSRHGKLFPLGTTMATHPACRCSWSPYLGKGLSDEWQSGESWLKEQPLTVQQDILGKLGAADFRAGNLQLSDFERTGFDKDWGPTGHFGGVEWARKQAQKAGRAPSEWATAPPITRTRKVTPKQAPKKATQPASRQAPARGRDLTGEAFVEFMLDV